jgi:hypothetical protein
VLRVVRVVAAVVLLNVSVVGQGGGGARPSPLRVTAEVVGRRYCAGEGSNILQLRVRLRYRNAGAERVILYRGKNLFYQTKIRGGAAGKQYEAVVLNSRFNDAEAEAVNGTRPGGAFVTLSPAGSYETEVVVGVAVAPEGKQRGANMIAAGEHTLQIVASTWYESKKLGEELRERWRGTGLLWVDPVATEPLRFTAGLEAPAAACR